MAAKVLIERRVIPGKERNALEILKELRVSCMDQRGYVSGETLLDTEDRQSVVVISTWWSSSFWHDWQQSPTRAAIEAKLAAFLAEPERVRVFADGLSEDHAGA